MKHRTLGNALFLLVAFSALSLAFQQYAGQVNLEVYNGTQYVEEYRWLLNDGPEPIKVSIKLACDDGQPQCDFLKYVSVSPKELVIPPYDESAVNITCVLPPEVTEGEFTGYMFAKLLSESDGGQVAIQLQVGKVVKLTAIEKLPEQGLTIIEQSKPIQEATFWTLGNIVIVAAMVLCVIVSVAYIIWAVGRKPEEVDDE